jgi:hypothetical protein
MHLSERFRGEIVKTNAYIVMDDDRMNSIIEESDIDISECSTLECFVQIGRALDIEKIVTGQISKFEANTYIIDISYIDIESGQIEKSFNRDYAGNLRGVFNIFREIAIEMIPPKEGISKIPLYASGIITIGAASVTGYSIYKSNNSYKKYQDAVTGEDAARYKSDTEKYDDLALKAGIVAGAAAITYLIYNHYYKRSLEYSGFAVGPNISDGTYGLAINFSF